jgi:NAD(P)-dependent dehydrogenase (short-subunit alcohol dehydrogenase family)
MLVPEYSLEGKRALISGGGRGIGRAIALVLAEAGADVAVTGLTPTGVNGVAESIRARGRAAAAFVADATRQDDMDRLAQESLEQFGPIDVLVNCVGDSLTAPVVPLPDRAEGAMSQADWQRIVDTNLTEAFLGARAFGPQLVQRGGGSVINISSFAAYRTTRFRSAYDSAKAGLNQFTRNLALEWAPHGVRVNGIAPGLFLDPEQLSPEEYQGWKDQADWRVPLARLGQLREVGLLALFLASDASAYITGQTIVLDGGLVL